MTDQFEIRSLGHLGDGVADGPTYVPFALPGEVVTGERNGDRLENVRILNPSDDRVKAPCRHFKICGGCVLQHASDQVQRNWRIDQIETALAQHGVDASVGKIHVSGIGSRRRVGFVARKTKSGAALCFHRSGSHALVDIDECAVAHNDIVAQFDGLKEVAKLAATRKAPAKLHVTRAENGLDAAITEACAISAQDIQILGRFSELCRVTWNGEIILQKQAPIIFTDSIAIRYPSGAFLQATMEGQAVMVHFVKDVLQGAEQIADFFCGCGTFGLALARHSGVIGFENDESTLAAMRTAWTAANGLKPLEIEHRDLFRSPVLAKNLKLFDAAVLDPPRAGAAAQIAELAQSDVARIAYVSCNPASFARDAKHLVDAGYTLERLEAVDQFRWSTHIELMSLFVR
ncbi:MAG: class I SAM-dependent RNA methyltransferase [Pseudomonadota bacterium]